MIDLKLCFLLSVMHNPILPGFNPDPSISYFDGKYYIITSSFQWYPGLPIYESEDLRNWRLIGSVLRDASWPDLRRIGDSAGIWAPCLTRADNLWWVVFTVASGSRYHVYECQNYVITSPSLLGPWSEPVFLNATGNDPSLFHDDDGRKWLVNTAQDKIGEGEGHMGTLLSEYSPEQRRLVGPTKLIFPGTDLGIPEGSKLHKHGGLYYLLVAEGGTEYGHAVTVARARDIWGPYEVHPDNPVLSARGAPQSRIQRAGHADLVTLPDGQVAVVYLASRPVGLRSHLGRETFLARGRWALDGWLRLDSSLPLRDLPNFALSPQKIPFGSERDEFDSEILGLMWNGLRKPYSDLIDLKSTPGWLRLKLTPSFFDSIENPAIVARRVCDHLYQASTRMKFAPADKQHFAGLICYYDTRRFYFLGLGLGAAGTPSVFLCEKGAAREFRILACVAAPSQPELVLGVRCDGEKFTFWYADVDGQNRQTIGPPCDALILSDEQAEIIDPVKTYGFTGSFVGVAGYNIWGKGADPAFDWFEYRPMGDFWEHPELK